MGCVGSKAAEASQLQGTDSARPDTKDAFMLAERFFEQQRSLRAQERDSLNRVLLNSRVEHDNSAGSTAVEPSVARSRSGSGRSPTETDAQSVAASQTSVLEHFNRNASLRNGSASSVRSGGAGRSTSGRSVESEARRERRRQERLRKEEEELAMAMAVSASEADAVAAAMDEPITLDDARAIAEAQAELDRSEAAAATGAAAHPDLQQPKQHRHRSKQGGGGRGDAAAAVRRTRSSNSACETIREDREEEIKPGDGDKQQRRSNTLRGRYTASDAVPKQLTDADQAAYERVRALQQAGSSHSDSDDVQHHVQPLKRSSNDSDAGGSINCSDDTAYAGSVSDTSPQRLQTLTYIAECEQKLGQIPPSRRRSLERQAKQQQVMRQRELELEDHLRSSRGWRQTSLGSDSAYEPASTGKLQQVHAPRGFMVA
jgi:hypothetical protein